MQALARRCGSPPDGTGWASCPRSAGRGLRAVCCWPGHSLGLPGPPCGPGLCPAGQVANRESAGSNALWRIMPSQRPSGPPSDQAPDVVREAVPTAKSAFLESLYWCFLQLEGELSSTMVRQRRLFEAVEGPLSRIPCELFLKYPWRGNRQEQL